MKKGFSMADLLITIIILGILSMLLISSLNIKIDGAVFYRKALTQLSGALNEVLTDDDYFRQNVANVLANDNLYFVGEDPPKMSELLSKKFNIKEAQANTSCTYGDYDCVNFTSIEGIKYMNLNFSDVELSTPRIIAISVPITAPNRFATRENNCNGRKYKIALSVDGKLFIPNDEDQFYCEIKALKNYSKFMK